jgi:uncharacterized phage protein (TIGR02218 family)
MPRLLPTGMQSHLDSGTTTMCWCWKISRRDGVLMGFTDHDVDIVFDGVTFEATSGFTGTELQESVGLGVDNLDVQGALQSTKIREVDILAGLYDDAQITIYRVNWQTIAQRILIKAGSLGEVTRSRAYFRAEVRGISHYLQQPKGRMYQYSCDADLGDSRCTKNITTSTYSGNGTVSSIIDARTFTATGITAYTSEWFSRGLISWTSGLNNTRKSEVKTHRNTSTGQIIIELWTVPPVPLVISDGFNIKAGCNKSLSICVSKFANAINFRGFPHIPGNDTLTKYPNKDDAGSDGQPVIV